MKILMLVNWTVEYCETVPEDKQPPDYYIEGQPYWFFRYFPPDYDVDVVDIRSFDIWENLEKNTFRFYIWQTLKVVLQLNKYDIILSHGMQSGIVLCMLRRLFGKGNYKHIVFDIGAFNSARKSGMSLKLMQFASKSLDGVIYHTKSQLSYYQICHPWIIDKSKFITFGTDVDFFNFENVTELEDNPYIVCIGYHKRDWKTLIGAFRCLSTSVHLRMIGNDKLGLEIPFHDERIEILPPVTITELKKQIEGALFCVLPLQSFNYSYGQMTLLQQMALGKAVIAADVPSIRDYAVNDCLILYQPEDINDLKDKMKDLLSNSEKVNEIGKNATVSVKELFNEQKMAEEIYEFIREVVSQSVC